MNEKIAMDEPKKWGGEGRKKKWKIRQSVVTQKTCKLHFGKMFFFVLYRNFVNILECRKATDCLHLLLSIWHFPTCDFHFLLQLRFRHGIRIHKEIFFYSLLSCAFLFCLQKRSTFPFYGGSFFLIFVCEKKRKSSRNVAHTKKNEKLT